jgi:hypothetical protein
MSAVAVESVKRLTQSVRDFDHQQREQDLYAALQTEVVAMKAPVGDIAVISRLLRSTPLQGSASSRLPTVRKALEQVRSEMEPWNARRLRDSGALTALRKAIDQLHAELRANAQRRWREFKEEHPVPKIGELVGLLDRLRIEQRLILSINVALARLKKAEDWPYPPDPESFAKYVEDLEKVRHGASQIGLEGSWPASVTTFLQYAAAQGAPLDLLTDEVRSWLVAQDYAKYFRIVPVSA